MSEDDLKEFFAVTTTSLYRVVAFGKDNYPYAEKLALHGNSKVLVGSILKGDPMLAVAKNLQFFYPHRNARDVAFVNNAYWGAGTSLIVALFLNEKEARDCFEGSNLLPCDERWIKQTKEVLEKIGDNHPNLSVCHWRDDSLMPIPNHD
jgi:hypothetical protein